VLGEDLPGQPPFTRVLVDLPHQGHEHRIFDRCGGRAVEQLERHVAISEHGAVPREIQHQRSIVGRVREFFLGVFHESITGNPHAGDLLEDAATTDFGQKSLFNLSQICATCQLFFAVLGCKHRRAYFAKNVQSGRET